MTCIVAVEDAAGVTMGADSAAVSQHNLTIRADEKIFTVGDYLIGFTTSFRMGQIIRYTLETAPPPRPPKALDAFMATTFVGAVRDALEKGGFLQTHEGRIEAGDFLVATHGRLYCVCSDLQVGRAAAKFDAVGSGGNIAVGSLHTSATFGLTARHRVRSALAAAAALNTAVAPPFRIKFQAKR